MMRRMKIRAKPNFGGGGGAPRGGSVPGKGSGVAVEAQGSQTQDKIISAPVEEGGLCPSQATGTDTLSAGSAEPTSVTQGQGMSNDAGDVEPLMGAKSHDGATASPSCQINTAQPSPTGVQEMDSLEATQGTEKLQAVTESTSESGNTVSLDEKSHVASTPLESDACPVPKPHDQPLSEPQHSASDAASQSIHQSMTHTPAKSVDVSFPHDAMPLNETVNDAPKDIQQDSKGKSAVCMRRNKLKVKPMFGGVRKAGVMDKPKMKASDNDTNAPNIKIEGGLEKPSVNQANNQEIVSSPEDIDGKHLNLEMQERPDTDTDVSHISKKLKEQVKTTDPNEKTSAILESSQPCEIHSTKKEMLQVKEEGKSKNVVPVRICKEEVTKGSVETPAAVNQMPSVGGDNVPSQTTSESSAPTAGFKRRAKIRAKPTLIMKKKKESDNTKVKLMEQAPVTSHQGKDVSPQESVAGGSESVAPDTVVVEQSNGSTESHQGGECKGKPGIVAIQKEVTFSETEANRQHSHLTNLTDSNKESKESDQAQRIKREGNAEIPLQSILKTSRKKVLSENKVDSELEIVDVINTTVEKQGKKKSQNTCEELVNSDDSTGDKENAATAITEMAKQERIPKETSSVISQKTKTKTPIHVSKLCGKLGKKIKLEDVADSPDRVKKQIFRARKNQFRKKMSEGGMEHSKMTMFDLIYWNPASNPMPGSTSSPKRNAQSTSKDDTDSITSEAAEEQRVDDLGLVDPLEIESDHAIISSPGSPEVVKIKEQDSENPQEESKDPLEEEKEPGEGSATNEDGEKVKDIFAPRVKIGPNGEIIVDEQSIKIQTTAAKNRDEVLSKAVVVEEIGDSSYYGKWSKRRKRSYEWTVKETALFYKALSTVGTDFSLMEILIKWRTRAELKTKFKKEERNNRDTVDRALNDSTQFDMTVFEEETDYDPKEDRKAARQAERAEAKRRRMAMKQEDKIKKMELKKLETKKIKTEVKSRKKLLRKIYRNRGRKRKEPEIVESDNEESPLVYESDSGVDEAALEESPPQDKVTVKARVMPKREAKRRNSLVISEVTVTVETVKYDKPASEVLIERTVREHEAEPEVARPSQGEEASTEECEGPQEEAHPSLSPEHITAHHTDELIAREEQDHEMILLDEYSELPLSEGLPENFIIGMLTENDENNSNNEDEMVDVETLDASTSEDDGTAADLQPGGLVPEPYDEEQRVWHFPVSAIQTLEDGQQVIVVPTDNGHYSVPVPILPPGTSKLVVMATDVPDSPGELIYHVYVVSPLEAGES